MSGHHHSFVTGRKLLTTVVLNVGITLAQAFAGFLSGSLALLSDALHNFSDVVALLISYVAHRLAQKEQVPERTFGYRRAEIIAAWVNAAVLLAIAIILVEEAIERLGDHQPIETYWVIVLSAASILVNGWCAWLLHREAQHSLNLRSAYLHLFSDMLSSVAVLLGGLAIWAYEIYWLDSVLSILIAGYLVYASWGVLLKSLNVLMQFSPEGLSLEDVMSPR